MNYSEFTRLAKQEIQYLYESLERENFEEDYDLINEILYINTKTGDYVINQHSPSRQIWLSSPKSNVGYFSFDENSKQWNNKNNLSIRQILSKDLEINIS